jgi:hypothetical protein
MRCPYGREFAHNETFALMLAQEMINSALRPSER